MRRRLAVVLVLILVVAAFGTAGRPRFVLAQGLPPLPDGLLGEGWAPLAAESLAELDATVFVGGDVTTLGGPAGARVRVVRYQVAGTMSAVRQSWDAVGEVFESYRFEIDTDYDYQREEELAALPLPDGCADGRRIYGQEQIGGAAFPVGLTLCAADPNLMVLVFASGSVGDRIGHEASDAVAARVLAATLGIDAGSASAPAEATQAPAVADAPAEERPVGNRDDAGPFTVTSYDIYYDPKELTIPADEDVTLLLPNEGAAPHNFIIDELDIRVEQEPDSEQQTVINAPAGVYGYYCDIPGHREAGMVGELTVTAERQRSGRATDRGGDATEPPSADLVDRLPAADDVPDGLAVESTAERSAREVADTLGGSDEDIQLLADWGWSGNAVRDFTGATDAGTYALNASIHRFADAAAADDALVYFSEKLLGPAGYDEVETEPLGDAVRLLAGAPDGDRTAVVYVRDGDTLYRVGGSADGDPTPDVLAVARAVLDR